MTGRLSCTTVVLPGGRQRRPGVSCCVRLTMKGPDDNGALHPTHVAAGSSDFDAPISTRRFIVISRDKSEQASEQSWSMTL